MKLGVLGLVLAATPAAGRVCRCPCPVVRADSVPAGAVAHADPARVVGSASPLVVPRAEAFAHNRAGRDHYRQRRWNEARAAYRAALSADPAFLAPRLNIACAFAQEERFAEAVAEAAALVEAGYVPWAREVEEAADLAPLRTRPEWAALRARIAAAAPAWGASITTALPFIARTALPVKVAGEGTLVLALAQEIFAYLPRSGGYRQITAEDGRVLAFVRSPDGARLVYLGGGKLVRSPGVPPRLRALWLRQLDLASMALGPRTPVPGDVERVALTADAAGVRVSVTAAGATRVDALVFDGQALAPAAAGASAGPGVPAPSPAPVVVTGEGVLTRHAAVLAPEGCRFAARDVHRSGAPPGIVVRPAAGAAFPLVAPHGAGLAGLPFAGPDASAPVPTRHRD